MLTSCITILTYFVTMCDSPFILPRPPSVIWLVETPFLFYIHLYKKKQPSSLLMDALEMPLCSLVTHATPFVSGLSSCRVVLHTAGSGSHGLATLGTRVLTTWIVLSFLRFSFLDRHLTTMPRSFPCLCDCRRPLMVTPLRVASMTALSSSIRRFHLPACPCEWCHHRRELRQLGSWRVCLPRYWGTRLHEGLHCCCQRVSSWGVGRSVKWC